MADDVDATVKALRGLSPEDQAAMQPETFANPALMPPSNFWSMQPHDKSNEHVQFQTAAGPITSEDIDRGINVGLGAGPGIFGGKLARTADLSALKEANLMAKHGQLPNQIWQDTGWFKPVTDNKWRFEIPDDQARMMGHGINYAEEAQGVTGPAPLMLQHKELYRAYPELNDAYISNNVYKEPANGIGTGEWDVEGPKMTINAPNLQNATSVGLHEAQHAVQDIENFARGGNSGMFSWMQEKSPSKLPLHELKSDPYDMYQRLAGEVEARNVQTRQPLTQEQRKLQMPWRTQDEDYRNQLVFTDPKTMLVRALKRNQ